MSAKRPIGGWNTKTFAARVRSISAQQLYSGGSPDAREIRVYASALSHVETHNPRRLHALVLGMTPALRRLLLQRGWSWSCVDRNSHAIEFYRGWLDTRGRRREKIIEADWRELATILDRPVDAILGDGVFGNLLTLRDHTDLLQSCTQVLTSTGVMVFRKILLPNIKTADSANGLLRGFRSGKLSQSEFGFGMRIEAGCEQHYNHLTSLLDNGAWFSRLRQWHKDGKLTTRELAIIERYSFDGKNLVPSCDRWEQLLNHSGLRYRRHQLTGKRWYAYYPIYCCEVRGRALL